MTWRELIEQIPENKLDTEVTIYDDHLDEVYFMSNFGWDNEDLLDGSFEAFYITLDY